jgi:hypothetical protein
MSRESIIRWIVEREASGQKLSEDAVSREFETVHSEACNLFGTWETALLYAGYKKRRPPSKNGDSGTESKKLAFDEEPAKRSGASRSITYRLGDDTSSESVIRMLQKLCRGGYGLSEQTIAERDHRLFVASCEHFGTLNNALMAAGINLENITTRGLPAETVREELIISLQKRKADGKSMTSSEVSLDNRSLASSVRSVFGSWKRGLLAAQLLDPSELRRPLKYDRQRILEGIAARHKEGKSLSRSVSEIEARSLVYGSKLYFPSWTAAVAAAIQWSEQQPKKSE